MKYLILSVFLCLVLFVKMAVTGSVTFSNGVSISPFYTGLDVSGELHATDIVINGQGIKDIFNLDELPAETIFEPVFHHFDIIDAASSAYDSSLPSHTFTCTSPGIYKLVLSQQWLHANSYDSINSGWNASVHSNITILHVIENEGWGGQGYMLNQWGFSGDNANLATEQIIYIYAKTTGASLTLTSNYRIQYTVGDASQHNFYAAASMTRLSPQAEYRGLQMQSSYCYVADNTGSFYNCAGATFLAPSDGIYVVNSIVEHKNAAGYDMYISTLEVDDLTTCTRVDPVGSDTSKVRDTYAFFAGDPDSNGDVARNVKFYFSCKKNELIQLKLQSAVISTVSIVDGWKHTTYINSHLELLQEAPTFYQRPIFTEATSNNEYTLRDTAEITLPKAGYYYVTIRETVDHQNNYDYESSTILLGNITGYDVTMYPDEYGLMFNGETVSTMFSNWGGSIGSYSRYNENTVLVHSTDVYQKFNVELYWRCIFSTADTNHHHYVPLIITEYIGDF
jgi:hypothetical protein